MLLHVYDNDLPELLTALAATPPMQRLRAVGMNCGCEYTAFPRFARGRSYSRWVHSLGVGAIVWRFTHDPAQAAAGLLHDVATPTFAHVIDFLRGDYLTQEATEEGTRERIAASPELQSILRAHGLTTDDVADYHRYPIADNDSPRLSADRLEYTLGNAWRYGFLTEDGIEALYADLTVRGPLCRNCPGLRAGLRLRRGSLRDADPLRAAAGRDRGGYSLPGGPRRDRAAADRNDRGLSPVRTLVRLLRDGPHGPRPGVQRTAGRTPVADHSGQEAAH